MPVFFSTIQWSDTILDFNAGFRVPHTNATLVGTPFTPFIDPFTVNGVGYPVASHIVQVATELTQSFGTSVGYLDGSGFTC